MADARYSGPKIERTTAAAVGGHRAIALVNNFAVHADQANAAHNGLCVGISTQAAAAGGTVAVQVFGPMAEPGWVWTPNQPIYVGGDGVLTQTPPVTGWLQRVAVALTSTKIFVDPQPPIKLA